MAAITKATSPKWCIESPQIVPEDDQSFLCDICRHISFQYLIFEIPIWFVSDEIPLDSYSRILEKQHCAFCRLIKYTIDNIYGADELPTEHEGKCIMISMVAHRHDFTLEKKTSEPRNLSLWVKPDPLRKGRAPSLEIQHIVEGSWLDSDGKGRLISKSQIDFLLPLFWNRVCRKSLSLLHKDHLIKSTNYDRPKNFRLIDTKKMCIVPAESSFEYIALSYTWGNGKQFRLLEGNEKKPGNYQVLGEEGSLLRFNEKIPQTIKDAMFLVEKLGDRYLWVDALCIIQDSKEDKKVQLPYMDRIYGSSVLTIAANYGDGADAGLPGVQPKSRKLIQRCETIQGIRMANRPWSFDQSVTDSKWNTRAWTFQERVLSSRMLFITKQQIFFKCDHVAGVLAEDLDTRLKKRTPVTYPMDDTGKDTIPQRWSINILSYVKIVESFTARDLSYPEDVLDAFSGIVQNLTPLFRSGFLFGLPQAELDYCLLWEQAGHLKCRTKLGTVEPIFPSWSWAGWVGPVRYDWEERLSRVKWVHPSSGELYTASDYRFPFHYSSEQNPDSLQSSEWHKEWTVQKSSSGFRYYYHASDPDTWFRNPTAPESERFGHVGPDCLPGTDHLRFWAWPDDIVYIGEYIPPTKEQIKDHQWWQIALTDDKGFATGYFKVPIELMYKLDFKNKKYDMVMICRTRTGLSHADIRVKKDASDLPGSSFSEDEVKLNLGQDKEDNQEDTKLLEGYDDAKDVSMDPAFFRDLPEA